MADTVRVGKNGEIVLPRRIRAALSLEPGDELEISLERQSVVLRRRAGSFRGYLERLTRTADRDEER
jgi:AbrB family looped-hinge helix DNA binding protein